MPNIIDLRKKAEEPKEEPQKEEAKTFPKESIVNTPKVAPAPPEKPKEVARPPEEASDKKEPQKVAQQPFQNISWQTSSFGYNPSKKYLYIFITALLVAAGLLFYLRIDMLLAIVFIMVAVIFFIDSRKKPAQIDVLITDTHIEVGEKRFYYHELKSFWLEYQIFGVKELIVYTKKWYMPPLRIQLENQNPLKIRELLIDQMPEKENSKSIIDILGDRL